MHNARLTRRHWLLALLLAVSTHAAGMWLLLAESSEVLAPAGAGIGLQISLAAGSGGGSGGGDQPQPTPEPVQATRQPPVVEQPQKERRHHHHERKPKPKLEKRPPPQPVEKTQPQKQEPQKPKPPVTEPVAETPAPIEPEPKQPPAEPQASAPTAVAPTEALQETSEPEKSGGGAGGQSQQTQTRAGDGRASGAGDSLKSSYAGELLAWLERHKEYPRLARMQRIQGTALLHFRLSRDGRVLEFSLRRSSGNPLLDKAVREMLERAQPLPPIPDAIAGEDLVVTLPIEFKLW